MKVGILARKKKQKTNNHELKPSSTMVQELSDPLNPPVRGMPVLTISSTTDLKLNNPQ